jgi:Skp family chaperone for outer membrane proteins
MKKVILVAVAVLGVSVFASEGGFKVGFVDLQKTLQSVEAGKSAKAALEKEVTAKRTGLEKQQQQILNKGGSKQSKLSKLSKLRKTNKLGKMCS